MAHLATDLLELYKTYFQQPYCVNIERLPEDSAGLRYGMRGIARLSGGKVFLGYRLFKSLVLYFRGL